MHQHGSPPRTLGEVGGGGGSKRRNSTFSEHGHVAYQIDCPPSHRLFKKICNLKNPTYNLSPTF